MDPRCGMLAALRRSWLGGLAGLGLLGGGAPSPFATNSTHWAFQPFARVSVPGAAQTGEIDAFVSATLTKNGRKLAAAADRRTIIRRLSFDHRGLPPSLDEVAAFLKDTRPDAYPRLVESFLESPRYGERWGRHWLDI